MSEKVFALVDANNFYCSAERVFRPELNNRPVVVLSNNDGNLISLSEESKRIEGLKMGDAFHKVRSLCQAKGVTVFSSNYALYGDMSRRVTETLQSFTPELEVYSIDESFISLSGFEKSTLTAYSHQIRQTVHQHTGIPVSVGVAPTKVLAKLCNRYAKKHRETSKGVTNFFDFPDFDSILQETDIRAVWGLGHHSTEKLRQHKIVTAYDLKLADEKLVQALLTVVGRRIAREIRGESCLEIEEVSPDKKQILSSRSFGRSVVELDEIQEALSTHVTTVAERLRKQNSITKALSVYIQAHPAKNPEPYYKSLTVTLPTATASTQKLITAASKAMSEIFRRGYIYKRVGVMLMDLQGKDEAQMDFFAANDTPVDDKLMKAMDLVNKMQGRGSIKFASSGTDAAWEMKSEMKSPNYSTKWSDLLEVDI
ncbi:MAG: Y-family DNA polymerase [Proteobacteria bacterium]|nr:MAG: Y-family DNA polymerase [Pseudomonadota bacterium]